MMLVTSILQMAFVFLAAKFAVDRDTTFTIFFCMLAICEEISWQFQLFKKEASRDN